jgi:SagB-type dehydrogenase family enzyme
VTDDGVSRYLPQDHALQPILEGDLRRELFQASLEQEFILEAPATIVFTAVFARTEQRYGSARSPRYIHMEVGHAAQNVLLQAVELGLGAVPVGAYEDPRVSSVLDLPADHVPLYMISIGHPR